MLSLYLLMLEDEDDEQKFRKILAKYEAQTYAYAYSLVSDARFAEEIVQSTFLAVARHIKKLRTEDEHMLKGYISTTVRNASLRLREKNSQRPLDMDFPDDVENELSGPAERLETEETVEVLKKCIKALPDIYCEVITFYYLYEFKITDIAKQIGERTGTVKTRLSRARGMLKAKLKEAGIDGLY